MKSELKLQQSNLIAIWNEYTVIIALYIAQTLQLSVLFISDCLNAYMFSVCNNMDKYNFQALKCDKVVGQ
jgi:hypothetical protein